MQIFIQLANWIYICHDRSAQILQENSYNNYKIFFSIWCCNPWTVKSSRRIATGEVGAHGMDHRKRMPRPRNLLMWIGHNKWAITDGLACIVRPSTTSELRMGASIDRLRHLTDANRVEHLGAQSQTILTVSSQLKNSIVIFVLLLILFTVLS